MKKIISASMAFMLMFFAACSSDNQIFPEEMPTVENPSDPAEDENEGEVVVPTEQSASTIVSLEDVAKKGLGGIKLNFTMSGITKIELESVDGYQLAGNLSGDKESIITFSAPEGETLTPGKDYSSSKFIDTYTQFQKEVWALGPRPHHKKGKMKSDAQTEQEIKQRFEMSEKILNIRQKYYKKYSQFLTQQQIQRVYEIERQMRKRFAQKGPRKGGAITQVNQNLEDFRDSQCRISSSPIENFLRNTMLV